jgi:hypothetical protein
MAANIISSTLVKSNFDYFSPEEALAKIVTDILTQPEAMWVSHVSFTSCLNCGCWTLLEEQRLDIANKRRMRAFYRLALEAARQIPGALIVKETKSLLPVVTFLSRGHDYFHPSTSVLARPYFGL